MQILDSLHRRSPLGSFVGKRNRQIRCAIEKALSGTRARNRDCQYEQGLLREAVFRNSIPRAGFFIDVASDDHRDIKIDIFRNHIGSGIG